MTPTTAIQGTIAGSAAIWAVVLPVATYVAAGPSDDAWHTLAFAVYGLGSIICHQAAERSFVLLDAQFPVCARCAGLYVGAAVVSIAWTQRQRFARSETLLGLLRGSSWFDARRVVVLGSIPTAATLAYEWSTGVSPTNGIRALAGVVLGLSITSLLLGVCDVSVASRPFRAGSSDQDRGAGHELRRG